jgi:hypothetical protein
MIWEDVEFLEPNQQINYYNRESLVEEVGNKIARNIIRVKWAEYLPEYGDWKVMVGILDVWIGPLF